MLLRVLCACATAAAGTEAPQLSVTPSTGPVDAPLHVAMRNLLPGTRVKVSAARPDARGRNWTAVGVYLADASGTIDVDVSPSLEGSYTGVSPHGLWCSALPVAPEKVHEYLADLREHPELGTSPYLDVSALYTVSIAASIEGKVIATATATRSYANGIVPEEVTAPGGVRGRFYPPRGSLPVCPSWCSRVPAGDCPRPRRRFSLATATRRSLRASSTTRICPRPCVRSRSRAFARVRSG